MRIKFPDVSALEVIILLVIVAILVSIIIATVKECSPENQRELYNAWCSANPEVNISFDEWKALREHNMLPGQQENEVRLQIQTQ